MLTRVLVGKSLSRCLHNRSFLHSRYLSTSENGNNKSNEKFMGDVNPDQHMKSTQPQLVDVDTFLDTSYTLAAGKVAITTGIATLLSFSPYVALYPGSMLLAGLGIGTIGAGLQKASTGTSTLRIFGTAALVSGMGIASSPVFFLLYSVPEIVAASLITTSAVSYLSAKYGAHKLSEESLPVFCSALTGGVLVVFGVQCSLLVSEAVYHTNLATLLGNYVLFPAFFIPVVAGIMVVDVRVAKSLAEQLGKTDEIGLSSDLYLDFLLMNLLVTDLGMKMLLLW